MAPSEALVGRHARVTGMNIDVVIPVFNAAADLAVCVESVLRNTPEPHRLILIDDGSSDPRIRGCFDELQARALPHLLLLRNEVNLGFTLTANRGFGLSSTSDVVLLNSDTVVTRGWLTKLHRCAVSDERIGTVTPFSNNAEICSLPRFCVNNEWPAERDPEVLNSALEHSAVPTYPDIPTGVGFCLYVRRALLDAIGPFDPVFGRGYGEENDFCMRAVAAGFRNLLCEDTLVLHLGGSSFGELKSALAQRNLRVLLERHPHYEPMVHGYIAADPLAPVRDNALSHLRIIERSVPGVLHVIHGHGGGTEYHVRALIAESRALLRHYLLVAVGDEWQLEEHGDERILSFDFRRGPGESWRELLGGLCARFAIDLIHLHNISGCREGLAEAVSALGIPYGYTVHDLNFACPTITFLGVDGMYCGARTDALACQACLDAQPEFQGLDIVEWRSRHRALLAGSAFIVAPSEWSARTLSRYFPEHHVDVIPHGVPVEMPLAPQGARMAVLLPNDDTPVVAVLGAIGPDKGARRLERLVRITRERGLKLRWVLIGYLDRQHTPWQDDDAVLTVHGRYHPRELPDLLAHYRVRMVVFPSVCPETFSFTLSESWLAGRPVLVPPIGALAERVRASGGGWVLEQDEWLSDVRLLTRLVELLAPANAAVFDVARAQSLAAPHSTRAAMAEATVQIYRSIIEAAATTNPYTPLSPQRCLDALGYVGWQPPVVEGERVVAESDALEPGDVPIPSAIVRIARGALRIRRTFVGRLLYRLTPKPVLAALKAHLS